MPVVRRKSSKLTSFSHVKLLSTCNAGRVDDCVDNLSFAYIAALLKNFWIAWASFTVFSSVCVFSASWRSVIRPEGSPTNPVAPPIYGQWVTESLIVTQSFDDLRVQSRCYRTIENAADTSKEEDDQHEAILQWDLFQGRLCDVSRGVSRDHLGWRETMLSE